jgi:hypothetical protein
MTMEMGKEYFGNPDSVHLARAWIKSLDLSEESLRNSGKQTNIYVPYGDVRITLEIYNTGTINIEGPDSPQKIQSMSLKMRDLGKIESIKMAYRKAS